jgi:hypothetical protein
VRIVNGLHQNNTVVFDDSGVPILDTYEEVLTAQKQRRFKQISYLYVLCPYCNAWRVHGRALHETAGLIYRASHCVDCLTEDTGYALRIVGPWSRATRCLLPGRDKPPARRMQRMQQMISRQSTRSDYGGVQRRRENVPGWTIR